MKKLLPLIILLITLGNGSISFAQKQAPKTIDKNEITLQSVKMLKKTKASLQVFFSAETDNDEKNAWSSIVPNLLEGAVFENDINPKDAFSNDSKELPIMEYLEVIKTRFPKGLNYNIDFHKAKVIFKKNQEIYVYAKKFMQGNWYFDGNSKPLLNDYNWCRIVLKQEMQNSKKQAVKLKIAYMDNDIKEINSATNIPDFSTNLSQTTLEDVAEKIASDISKAVPKSETEEIIIDKMSFEGKNVINKFSELFTGELKTMLKLAHPSLKITLPVRSFNRVLQLKSNYTRQGDYLLISSTLINSSGKEIITTSNKILLTNAEDLLKDIIPSQNQLIQSDILTNNITNTPAESDNESALQFEIKTNKGIRPQSFLEGELLSIYVVANKPCKVRVIYKDAQNNLFFMNDNDFSISAKEINVPIKLPQDFKCSAPFGVEALIGFATTGTFRALKTEKKDGVTYLLEDLENLKNKSAGEQTIERVIPITTYAK